MLSFITIVSDYIYALTSVLFLWRFAERFPAEDMRDLCDLTIWWFMQFSMETFQLLDAFFYEHTSESFEVLTNIKCNFFLIFKKYINIDISLIGLWY